MQTLPIEQAECPCVPCPEILPNKLGVVIQPDAETVQRAYQMAQEVVGNQGEFVLSPPLLPHITLYQSEFFHGARSEVVCPMIDRLRQSARGVVLDLHDLISFWKGWIFWVVAPTSSTRPLLQELHESALSLSKLVDRARCEERAALMAESGFSSDAVSSVRTFGYSQAKEQFMPHITLGHSTALGRSNFSVAPEPRMMTVAEVQLCEMGDFGSMKSVFTW